MKNKTITITLIALLTLSTFGLLFTTLLTPAAAGFSPIDLSTMEPYAIGATPDMLGEKEVAMREYAAEVGAAVATQASPLGDPATIGEELNVTVSDMGLGEDYDETFVVIMDGTHGIILIEKAAYDAYDPATDEYVFPNPYGCWRTEDRISTAQLAYLLDEFDNNIYPTDTEIFGEPLPRGDELKKVWVLIHNIRGDSYYDCGQTSYIAGYFSSSEDAENNKNMMHIDTYDWINRIGPDSARPYLYEGVFAHEFQHLIHFDQDPDEPSWVDEACADLAMFMCGYGHPSSHVAYYMVYHPFTALTFWGGALEDYGASYLFALYLYEHYGGADFFTALVADLANGIEGIQNTLVAKGYGITFDDLYDDWTIANYLDDPEGGLYGYDSLNIGTIDSWGYSIEWALENYWVGGPFEAPLGFYASGMFGTPQPYTARYHRFGGPHTLEVGLEGDMKAGPGPYGGENAWYSDAEAWAWRSFFQTFDLPGDAEITLDFYTYFEIEDDWDYGYVEVFDHDAGDSGEWYTLDAPGTVDYIAHAQDNPNTPDGREPTTYNITERWHAFTGNSGGWIPVSMDLTPFAGHQIDLYFTTWQDGAFTLQMMYVDDISITTDVGDIILFDPAEDEGNWLLSPDPTWYVYDCYEDNDWQATLIETLWQPTKRYPKDKNWHARKLLNEVHMDMDFATQSGVITGIKETPVKSRRTQVLIISNRADHILPADYWVQFTFA